MLRPGDVCEPRGGKEQVAGVDTYRYKINIDKAPIEAADGVQGTYTNEVVIWVEPKTGGGTTVKFGIESNGANLGSVLVWTGAVRFGGDTLDRLKECVEAVSLPTQ